MKLEAQVCSLDLAKRLKELGVKQESHFVWNIGMMGGKYLQIGCSPSAKECWSAFTVAEMGEMLPSTIELPFSEADGGGTYVQWLASDKRSGKHEGEWMVSYGDEGVSELEQYALTEADARAKCLIYLIENNIISSTDIKS